MSRKPYPTDVSGDEWNFVAPYLALIDENAPQREYPLREVFNALRYISRSGEAWRMMPNDLPPWPGPGLRATRQRARRLPLHRVRQPAARTGRVAASS